MNEQLELLLRGVFMGLVASALMDGWSLALRRGFHVSTLDYRLLGRWIGHFPRGRFRHQRIAAAEPILGERPLGWLAHYCIGITFALLLLAICGSGWAESPTVWPALLMGLATIVAPWFLMQPPMGAGIAGSKSPNPGATRLRNLGTHTVYGAGLYASALSVAVLL